MTWLPLILISLISFSAATLFQRKFLSNSKVNEVTHSITYQFVIVTVYLLIGLFVTGIEFPSLVGYEINLVLMVIFYATAVMSGFLALKGMDASKYIVIITTRAIFTIFASSLFLSETLYAGQWIGAGLIFLAAIIVTVDSTEKLKFKFNKYELFAFLGAASFGLANTNDRFLLDRAGIEVVPYMIISFFFPAIFVMIMRPSAVKDFKKYKVY